MKKLFILIFITANNIQAFGSSDDLNKALKVSQQASQFQAERMKVTAENIANAETTSTVPGGKPYKRKIIIPVNKFSNTHKVNLLKTKKITRDKKVPFSKRHMPSHPAANEDGLVLFPNVDVLIERSDSLEAQRSFEFNLSAIQTTRSMINKTVELIK